MEDRNNENQPATKGDVRHLEAHMDGRMGKLETRMDSLETQIRDLRQDMREIRSLMNSKMFAVNNVAIGVSAILAALLSGMIGAVLF